MAEAEDRSSSLEYTPTWVVAFICFIIVVLSLLAERGLHHLGKCLKRRRQDALFEALQKLKEELMLLGFISLMLTVSQSAVKNICVPPEVVNNMFPCKKGLETNHAPETSHLLVHGRHLLASEDSSAHCATKGKVPLISLEALHHLHIFIFVLAVFHVIFCASTMILGGARIKQWKHWEGSFKKQTSQKDTANRAHPHGLGHAHAHAHAHAIHELFTARHEFFEMHAGGFWRRSVVVSWLRSFFKQFYGSVTKSEYITLRQGFIKTHCPRNPSFNFHNYMLRTLEIDFKKVVSISWYLWLFVVVFLLMNVGGWNTYFWLSFLPLILLVLVGAKLENIMSSLALEVAEKRNREEEAVITPSDEMFWFHRPDIVLLLIHFILFQNSFEIAFFFWILFTYGIKSCIMERLGFLIPRLVMGVLVQVLCSYSTLPLYALVTQMGSKFKKGIFDDVVQSTLDVWLEDTRNRGDSTSDTLNQAQAQAQAQARRLENHPTNTTSFNIQLIEPQQHTLT